MEGKGILGKKQSYLQTTITSALAMQKDSHSVSKSRPKIRIIHIFAPEIIKTDVANFRELVQRLTGKPSEKESAKPNKTRKLRRREAPTGFPGKKMELRSSEFRERIKGEEEEAIWGGSNSGGGYLGGFSDLDGFMQDLNFQFPFMPLNTSQMDSFGETTQIT